MIPQPVSIITGHSIGDDIQWGGGQDSFYEVCNQRDLFPFQIGFTYLFLPTLSSPTSQFPLSFVPLAFVESLPPPPLSALNRVSRFAELMG
jgi:hypothetical protein